MNKVIWLINGKEGFGISRATSSFAKEFVKDNKQLLFVSISEGRMVDLLRQQGHEVICLQLAIPQVARGSVRSFLEELPATIRLSNLIVKKLSDLIVKWEVDCFIYRSPNLTQIASRLRVKGLKIWIMPNTLSDHYFLNLNKKVTRNICRRGNITVIGNSHFTAQSIASNNFKPHVLHLGVDERKFNPALPLNLEKNKGDFGFEEKDVVFGVFARLDHFKAQDLVIEAIALTRQQFPEISIKAIFVGVDNIEAPFYKRCMELAEKLELQLDIVFEPTVSNIEQYYNVVDVMINSRRDAEPFGLTVIEAMLMRKPIIALGVGGPAETIVPGETGWLVRQVSAEGYADTMAAAISVRHRWKEIGERGRQHALDHFTVNRAYKNLLKIVEPAVPA